MAGENVYIRKEVIDLMVVYDLYGEFHKDPNKFFRKLIKFYVENSPHKRNRKA